MPYVEIDLATCELVGDTVYQNGRLVAPTSAHPNWVPAYNFAADQQYELVIDYVLTSTYGYHSLFSAGPDVDASMAYWLGDSPDVNGTAGTAGSLTMLLGPGVNDWDAAHVAGEDRVRVESSNFEITGARISVPDAPALGTDTTDRANGRTRMCEWTVEVEPPVTEPKRQRAHDYAIAVSLTEPTLVEGRPT